MKAKFEINLGTGTKRIYDLLKIEKANKFSVNFKKTKTSIIFDIQAEDISGIQACVNAYLKRINIIKKTFDEL